MLSGEERALLSAMRNLGAQLMAWRSDETARTVLSHKGLKLQADSWAHEILSLAIADLWPGIPVISEEDASHGEQRPPAYWLIDPIDGTASWLNGFSGFVTQAALIEAETPVAGFVFAPALNRFYVGLRGRGAWINEVLIKSKDKHDGIVLVDNTPEPHGIVVPIMQRLAATGYLESGSLGLKCCLVADGTADLCVKDVVVRDWDLAPASAIFREMGGVIVTTRNLPYQFFGDWEKRAGFIAARSSTLAARAAEAYEAITKGERYECG